MRWVGHVAHLGKTDGLEIFDRWEVNTKMYLQETECECVDRIQVVQDKIKLQSFMNVLMKLWIP